MHDFLYDDVGLVVPVEGYHDDYGMDGFTVVTGGLAAAGAVATGYLFTKGYVPLAIGTGAFTLLVGAYGVFPSWGALGDGLRSGLTSAGAAAQSAWATVRHYGDPVADAAVATVHSGVKKLETAQAQDRVMRTTGATHIERKAALAAAQAAEADEVVTLNAEWDLINTQLLHLTQAREQARQSGAQWGGQSSWDRNTRRRTEIVQRLEELGAA